MTTEVLPSYVTTKDDWMDFVSGQGAILAEETMDQETVTTSPKRIPYPKIKSYDKEGLVKLAETGQLRPGDLTGTQKIDVDGREVGVKVLLLNIGTRQRPDHWSMIIPTNPEERAIFIPDSNNQQK